MKYVMRVIFLIYGSLLLGLEFPAHSQKIISNVKIIRDKLQGRNLDLFEGLELKIQNYINDFDWSKNDDKTPLKIDIQLSLDKVSDEAGQKRVNATMFISNGKEIQYLDNNCVFNMSKGFAFYHDENQTDAFLSIIDFYMYIMLGDELDVVGKLKGTPWFQRAKNLAAQSKVMIAINARGWDERLIRADLFLDPRYQDYRIMKDHYYEGIAQYEEGEVLTARKNLLKAIDMMETLNNTVFTRNHTDRFIQGHYLELCKIFETAQDKSVFDKLISLSPKNKDTILRYKEGR